MESRREPRKTIAARVRANWSDPTGTPMTALAMLEDISISGASMRIRHAIDVGSHLEVEWQRQNFTGVVRFCRPDGIEFILGILKDTVPATAAPEPAP